jgi:hypothetical protein
MEPIEGFDSVAVGQEEIDQDRRYGVRSVPFLLCVSGQAFQTFGATSNPFDLKGPIARIRQGLSNGAGGRSIVLNQEGYFEAA